MIDDTPELTSLQCSSTFRGTKISTIISGYAATTRQAILFPNLSINNVVAVHTISDCPITSSMSLCIQS